MFKLNKFIAFIILISIIISCHSRNIKTLNDISNEFFLVKKIVDGDTFWVENGTDKGLKIRLIGVDAPESRKTGKKEIGYFGKEAKEYLNKLISGQKVKLVCDVDSIDRYGRTLAYVYLENGLFINADLVKNGYAMVMTFPPNVKFVDLFVQLQHEARINKKGLWNLPIQ
jgi:micrococcal nuclease